MLAKISKPQLVFDQSLTLLNSVPGGLTRPAVLLQPPPVVVGMPLVSLESLDSLLNRLQKQNRKSLGVLNPVFRPAVHLSSQKYLLTKRKMNSTPAPSRLLVPYGGQNVLPPGPHPDTNTPTLFLEFRLMFRPRILRAPTPMSALVQKDPWMKGRPREGRDHLLRWREVALSYLRSPNPW